MNTPTQSAQRGSAMDTLMDLIEDQNNNGDYRLSISGDDLTRLWKAVEAAQDDALRLERERDQLRKVCDALSEFVNPISMTSCCDQEDVARAEAALEDYCQLPHVK